MPEPEARPDRVRAPRLLFYSHQVETERSNQVRHKVELEWNEERYIGEASAADLPRPKLEAVATATLQAVERPSARTSPRDAGPSPSSLDGVKVVDAFDRKFVLVAVHAISGRDMTRLAGTTVSNESTDRAAILATLQATDRWVRGHME